MPRDPYVYTMILEYLKQNPGLHSTKEIQTATGASYDSVARAMRKLAKEKRVKRRSGSGHSYMYEFVAYEVATALPVGQSTEYRPLHSSYLKDIINLWISSGWTPKTIEASQTLVTTLSQLFQFQWLEITKGLSIDQSDLDHCKSKIINAKALADSFADFIGSLLATADLWDSKKLSLYMLSEEQDPQQFLEHARRVSEVLR